MFMIFFLEDFYKEVYYLVRWVTMTHYGSETDIFYGQYINSMSNESRKEVEQRGEGDVQTLHKYVLVAGVQQEEMS